MELFEFEKCFLKNNRMIKCKNYQNPLNLLLEDPLSNEKLERNTKG